MKASVQILSSRPVAYAKGDRKGEVFGHQCECFAIEPVQGVGVLMVNAKLAEPLLQEVDTVDASGNRIKQKQIPTGLYELEYGLTIGFQDKELRGSLKSIQPAGKGNNVLSMLSAAANQVREQQRAAVTQPKA